MKALPWPVGIYRRILPALTTNQNAGFVTVPPEKNIKTDMCKIKKVFLMDQGNLMIISGPATRLSTYK